MKKRVAVLISGNGGNLQALINACRQSDYPAEIVLVISNKNNAFGLVRASRENIPAVFIDHKIYPNRADFDAQIHNKLLEYNIEIVCLAGFMRLLTEDFVNKWQNKMLNIHPSLLPDFKGANAVEDALKAKVKITGCTVHYVVPEMDAGPIILQKQVEVSEHDDLTSLSEKIHEAEHTIYPQALEIACRKY
jgi:phosphoribosylglycinamide formyltransferase-1